MIFREEKGDLFAVGEDYTFVHCISKDCRMGAGIAVEFRKRFPNMQVQIRSSAEVGRAVKYSRVFNMITKLHYWDKPTYKDFTASLKVVADICKVGGIKKLAMPRIGCGLDQLNWDKVKEIINETFADTDIEILVRYL